MRTRLVRTAVLEIYEQVRREAARADEAMQRVLRREKALRSVERRAVADAVYGLERPLMQLVDFFKSAAQGYGTERRILLLHGPVGSSKSTIARLLKKGLESYSKTEPGKLFSYAWRLPRHRQI